MDSPLTDTLVVATRSGPVRGSRLPDGLTLFAGVPFAEPPIGSLRLRPPQPPRPWSDVRDATAFPPAPAQTVATLLAGGQSDTTSLGESLGTAWIPSRTNEDCLYLNVWTPDLAGRRPVIVWLYGGGYDSGSASPPITSGAGLSKLTGAVVVAPNYRVGALGYLHLADIGGPGWKGCTNFGLQDQAAALRWVRDNIAGFGGDPERVTVAGQSAGAFSVGALLATPAAAGTFSRAILSSGNTGRCIDAQTGTALAGSMLAVLGLDKIDDLRAIPVADILSAQRTIVDADIGRRNLPNGRAWGVVLDGDILPQSPQRAVAEGAATDIDILVGWCRDETRLFQILQGSAYAPGSEQTLLDEIANAGVRGAHELLDNYRREAPEAGLAELRTRFLGDAIYRQPACQLAAAQTSAGGRAYTYLFSAEPYGPRMGACHGADLPFLFDTVDLYGADTAQTRAVQAELGEAWSRFVAGSDPGWPPYRPQDHPNTRQFGARPDMIAEPPPDVSSHWKETHQRQGG